MGFIEVCELGLIEIMILLFKETIKLKKIVEHTVDANNFEVCKSSRRMEK